MKRHLTPLLLALLLAGCNVADSQPECAVTVTQGPDIGGMEHHLFCGVLNANTTGVFRLYDVEPLTLNTEWPLSDTLFVTPITSEARKWGKAQRGRVVVWLSYHDEAYTFNVPR